MQTVGAKPNCDRKGARPAYPDMTRYRVSQRGGILMIRQKESPSGMSTLHVGMEKSRMGMIH